MLAALLLGVDDEDEAVGKPSADDSCGSGTDELSAVSGSECVSRVLFCTETKALEYCCAETVIVCSILPIANKILRQITKRIIGIKSKVQINI